eukprot:TRINITY_DN16595_c0_g1_i2.p1 TRINITY_DN16595_c0_g1~~TRINITY_DN16595_c0_g1_i2.p1  ORF type:complete len:1455 (+),score=494.31 TRINITY_DN16595_c0_g1_i2:42-4406(+)
MISRAVAAAIVCWAAVGQATAPPTAAPLRPTSGPATPSVSPTAAPSASPTAAPRQPTLQPSKTPTVSPSRQPSLPPTAPPSRGPSAGPTVQPTRAPSGSPSLSPSVGPTPPPSTSPSGPPSRSPSVTPSGAPTSPSASPTASPQNGTGAESWACVTFNDTCIRVDECKDQSHSFHHGSSANDQPPYNIMALAGCVTAGALLRWAGTCFTWLRQMPYTILVFLVGVTFGLAASAGEDDSNALSLYDDLAGIDPHLMFFVFLPVLIFESAFATNTHVFKKVFWHCLWLAGPGLVVASGLTAVVVKFAFWKYEWSWVTSILFGTICSATDPVAVVALLKELGAGAEVSALIEGESLLNDGTAIVIFSVLQGGVAMGSIDQPAGEVVGEFCQIAFGGPLVGLVFAVLAEQVLEKVFNDPLVEVTLTLSVAYMTFFVAEGLLHVSGVLALVVLGLYLSYHCQAFSPEVELVLHSFWGILVFIANTVIFGLAGLIVSAKVFRELEGVDMLYLLILYLVINLARLLVVVGSSPLLRRIGGYSLDRDSSYLLIWGGLRGAVGLALCLIVENDVDIACAHPKLGPRMIFLVCGIVFLTLVVNGVSTGKLVRKLGLDAIPLHRRKAMSNAVCAVLDEQDYRIFELSRQGVMASVNWKRVRMDTVDLLTDPYSSGRTDEDMEMTFRKLDAWDEARGAYFTHVIASLWQQSHSGTLSARGCRFLLDVARNARDDPSPEKKLLSVDTLRQRFGLTKVDRAKVCLAGPCGGAVRDSAEITRWNSGFEVTMAFVNAHEAVVKALDSQGLRSEPSNRVRDHCKKVRANGLVLLGEYQKLRPNVAIAIKTYQASRNVLNSGQTVARELVASGALEPADGEKLTGILERLMERIRLRRPTELAEPTADDVLEQVKWASVDAAALHKLRQRADLRIFEKGDTILKAGVEETAIIVTGVVHVYVRGSARYKGPGYAVGLLRALSAESRMLMQFVADTDGKALYIANDELQIILRQSDKMREAAWKAAGADVAQVILSSTHPFSEWTARRLRAFASSGSFLDVGDEGGRVDIPRGCRALLLKGTCEWIDTAFEEAETSNAVPVCLLPANFDRVTVTAGTRLYCIVDPASGHEKAVRHWGRVRERLSLIHAMSRFLCSPVTLRSLRPDVLRRMIEGHFGQGRSLDHVTGGFGERRRANSRVGSPAGSPKFGGVKKLGPQKPKRKQSEQSELEEPLLAASAEYPPPLPSQPERRHHSKVLSPPTVEMRPTSPELAAAQGLEAAAAALRAIAASPPRQPTPPPPPVEDPWAREREREREREEARQRAQAEAAAEERYRAALLKAVAERERAEEELLRERECRAEAISSCRATSAELALEEARAAAAAVGATTPLISSTLRRAPLTGGRRTSPVRTRRSRNPLAEPLSTTTSWPPDRWSTPRAVLPPELPSTRPPRSGRPAGSDSSDPWGDSGRGSSTR